MESEQRQSVLIAVGGLSGSGKSSLIRSLRDEALSDQDVFIASSDEIRKELWSCPIDETLPDDAYSREFSQRTYDEVDRCVNEALAGGGIVFVDAVFATEFGRGKVEEAAVQHGAKFLGLWLDAPEEVIKSRADARVGDASDADSRIIDLQMTFNLGDIEWHRIDASSTLENTVKRALPYVSQVIDIEPASGQGGPSLQPKV